MKGIRCTRIRQSHFEWSSGFSPKNHIISLRPTFLQLFELFQIIGSASEQALFWGNQEKVIGGWIRKIWSNAVVFPLNRPWVRLINCHNIRYWLFFFFKCNRYRIYVAMNLLVDRHTFAIFIAESPEEILFRLLPRIWCAVLNPKPRTTEQR